MNCKSFSQADRSNSPAKIVLVRVIIWLPRTTPSDADSPLNARMSTIKVSTRDESSGPRHPVLLHVNCFPSRRSFSWQGQPYNQPENSANGLRFACNALVICQNSSSLTVAMMFIARFFSLIPRSDALLAVPIDWSNASRMRNRADVVISMVFHLHDANFWQVFSRAFSNSSMFVGRGLISFRRFCRTSRCAIGLTHWQRRFARCAHLGNHATDLMASLVTLSIVCWGPGMYKASGYKKPLYEAKSLCFFGFPKS